MSFAPEPTGRPGSWVVTGQTMHVEPVPGGMPAKGYLVQFTTGGGHQGEVFVPLSHYNADTVKMMIADVAARLDEVGQLSSES